ncbi:MAG: hypothetical protein GY820_37605 [Gammaproteobacteria bacterium]|nr:hypothetical protein [Gammaproteobacteria bacterium]
MKQFDVYINPGSSTRAALPFIVDIQNPVISELATRIVIPLGRITYFKNEQLNGLTPVIEYETEESVVVSFPRAKLQTATNRPSFSARSICNFSSCLTCKW